MVQILIEVIIAESGTHHSDASAPTNNPAFSWESRPAWKRIGIAQKKDLYITEKTKKQGKKYIATNLRISIFI